MAKETGAEVIENEEGMETLPESMEFPLEIVASRIQNYEKLLSFALKATKSFDWIDHNGKPYLMSYGKERVGRVCGISMTSPVREKVPESDTRGSYYTWFYNADGYFTRFPSERMPGEGRCSSRDQFFAKRTDEKGVVWYLPMEEVSERNVMAKALTQLYADVVGKLLGIRNLSWEFVTEATGITPDQVAHVRYGGASAEQEPVETGGKRKEIGDMLMDLNDGDAKKASEALEKTTSFIPKGKSEKDRVPGRTSVRDLTEKQILYNYTKIKKEWEKAGFPKKKTETSPPPDEKTESGAPDYNNLLMECMKNLDKDRFDNLTKILAKKPEEKRLDHLAEYVTEQRDKKWKI